MTSINLNSTLNRSLGDARIVRKLCASANETMHARGDSYSCISQSKQYIIPHNGAPLSPSYIPISGFTSKRSSFNISHDRTAS